MPLANIDFTDPAAVRRAFAELDTQVGHLHQAIGIKRFGLNRQPVGSMPPPPQVAGFALVGIDGRFLITLTNPADAASVAPSPKVLVRKQPAARLIDDVQQPTTANARTLFHQLRSSTNLTFDAVGDVKYYGPEARTQWQIEDPNTTRYWQVRSKYQNSEYNEWLDYINPDVCGVQTIWSEVLRNLATATLNTAYASNGGSPLTQDGVTTNILVGASSWAGGDGFTGTTRTVAYSSGHVDPGGYGLYYVYARDPKQAGGAVTYIATANIADINSFDDIVFFGKITTAGGGGGAGSGGGGGPCIIAGVMITKPDGSEAPAETFRKGQQVRNTDGGIDTLVDDPEIVGNVPCFRVTMANGLMLKGCSTRHSLLYDAGGMDFACDLRLGTVLWTKLGPAAVASKEFIGHHTVYKFHLDNVRTYITDGIGSHNANSK